MKPNPHPKKLLQVQTTFRHGARTPMGYFGVGKYLTHFTAEEQDLTHFNHLLCHTQAFFPATGHPIDFTKVPRNYIGEVNTPLPGGGLTGNLTRVGMQQALQLGQELKARYTGFIPETWKVAQRLVTVRSTYTKRTLATARGVLSGMFPVDAKAGHMTADIDLSGSPEHQVYHRYSCTKLQHIFQRCMTEHSQDPTLDAVRVVLRHPSVQWSNAEKDWEIISARDQYACREAENKPIPPEIVELDQALNAAAAKAMHNVFIGRGVVGEQEALRLSIGRMMTVIMDTIEKPDGKIHLYSGHDWTVTPLLLTACRLDEPLTKLWPPFCSNISFELWSEREDDAERLPYWGTRGVGTKDDGRYVRTVYNSASIDMPCSRKGDEYCTLSEFRKMMSVYKSVDYDKECEVKVGGGEVERPEVVESSAQPSSK